ncbi:MAG TPA: cation transporter [Terracidiphilus sp.]|jgi:divalent metal cation (Fe/Co/Zn/Cd) transporter|nr:cation transporter [Terracidiphilus sp.]
MTTSEKPEHCSACSSSIAAQAVPRQVAWLQGITLVWMVLECAGSLYAAARAHSAALLAFGADSLIELLSASVVLLQFLPRFRMKKIYAERSAAVLLFLLAGVVVLIAFLGWRRPVETSCLGIAVTALALIVMPMLAWLKRRQARMLDNRALAADATQSATCAYLAAVTLAGLASYALWHIAWLDSVTALAAVPILIVEGRRTWRGEGCGCTA